jgi:hypothetical protein
MRIYEGSPRQDFEEVFRSIGAFIDQRGMREVLLAEAPDGFIVQGLVPSDAAQGTYSDSFGSIVKETLTFLDDDLGRYMAEQKPRDVFFFEQDGAFVLRLLPLGAATRHTLAEFTREDIADMIAQAPRLRYPAAQTGARTAAGT